MITIANSLQICSASFGQKTHLNTHVKNVHKISQPFKCVECAAAFSSVQDLKYHLSTRHIHVANGGAMAANQVAQVMSVVTQDPGGPFAT